MNAHDESGRMWKEVVVVKFYL